MTCAYAMCYEYRNRCQNPDKFKVTESKSVVGYYNDRIILIMMVVITKRRMVMMMIVRVMMRMMIMMMLMMIVVLFILIFYYWSPNPAVSVIAYKRSLFSLSLVVYVLNSSLLKLHLELVTLKKISYKKNQQKFKRPQIFLK